MSKSFGCEQEWQERSSSSVLSSLDSGDFFRNLKKASDEKSFISSLDIDILGNKMSQMDESSYDLIEQIIYNHRHTPESRHSLPSSSHALIRSLLQAGQLSRLLKMLKDKIHYGVFLDDYTAVLLLDHFIDANRIEEALQVVIDLMLQEELHHPIIQALAYLAIHHHLSPQPTITLAPVPTIDPKLDVVYRKVPYIQNPYYDHHFDLFHDQLKIGKALVALTKARVDVVSRGYHVLGLIMLQNFEKALEVLGHHVVAGGVLCQKHLDQMGSALESLETREEWGQVKPGHKRLLHCVPSFTPQHKQAFLQLFNEMKEKLEGEGRVVEVDVEGYFGGLVTEARKQEAGMLEEQKKVYKEWIERRETIMEEQIESLKWSQQKTQIADKILELKESEERLRYYEQRVHMSLEMSRQPAYPSVKENVAEEMYVLPPGERKADRKKK